MENKIVEHTAVPAISGRTHHKVVLEVTLLPDERLEAIQIRHPKDRTQAPLAWFEDPKYETVHEGECPEKQDLSVTRWHLNMNRNQKPAELIDENNDRIHIVVHVIRGDAHIVQEGVGVLFGEDGSWEGWTPERITIRSVIQKWIGQ